MLTGMIKARNVIEIAPEKLRNNPNLGTNMLNAPVNKTTRVL
jgi:hypothetical protein